MGLNYNDVRCLMEWRRGNAGGKVATFGRLTLALHPRDLFDLRRKFAADRMAMAWLDRYRWGDYADDMFRELFRFDDVTSLDFSSYEGATVIQDIGAPLRPDLVGRFDLAIDGGTLEHVFNFPVAIGNLMRLVKLGGAVYTQNPCNSLAGHGFYQFSPELMFRVFSKSNGFQISFVRIAVARTLSIEQTSRQPVYEVVDPARYGGRVMLASADPVVMMSLAVKQSDTEPFAQAVLQSDYVEKWSGAAPTGLNWKGKLVEHIGKVFAFLPLHVARLRDRHTASVRNRNAYRRLW
jgi:hypothetical protein